jgi:flavin reductase (DIM6/NTAB) family NADH-FMN oxidoreductase RutF
MHKTQLKLGFAQIIQIVPQPIVNLSEFFMSIVVYNGIEKVSHGCKVRGLLLKGRHKVKINPNDLPLQDSSHLLTDIVVPRPIAWVSTVDENGVFNLAPFSDYSIVSSFPMVVAFSVGSYRDGRKKDTLRNIELSKEFVINVVTEKLASAMNVTSAPYSREVSEFVKAGLTVIKADMIKAPMVAESPVKMECCVIQIIEFGKAPVTSNLILGAVLRVHVADEFWNKLTKRVDGLRPIARLGGESDMYCRTQDTFQMKRPTI